MLSDESKYSSTEESETRSSDEMELLTIKPSVYSGDMNVNEALRASQAGHAEKIKKLMEKNLLKSVNAMDDDGCTLLHWSAINNQTNVMQYLLANGAKVDAIGGTLQSTPIHWACYAGHLEAVVLLVKNGANPFIKNTMGETALHVASRTSKSTLIAYILCKFPAIVDIPNKNGQTGIMLAAKESFGMFPIRIFVQFEARLNCFDVHRFNTALHYAVQKSNDVGTIELLAAGADANLPNREGKVPMDGLPQKKQTTLVGKANHLRKGMNENLLTRISDVRSIMDIMGSLVPLLSMIGLFMAIEIGNIWLPFIFTFYVVDVLIVIYYHFRFDDIVHMPVAYSITINAFNLMTVFYYKEMFSSIYVQIFMAVLWSIGVILALRLLLANPGVIHTPVQPRLTYIAMIESGKTQEKYCFTCWVMRPENSHHCRICDKCVMDFDHHCPWVSKCIYRKNQRVFLLLIGFSAIFLFILATHIIIYLALQWRKNGIEFVLRTKMFLIIYFIISFSHVVAILAVLYTQFNQICHDTTTKEELVKSRRDPISTRNSSSLRSFTGSRKNDTESVSTGETSRSTTVESNGKMSWKMKCANFAKFWFDC